MNNWLYRIKRRYEMTVYNWKNDCEFSKNLACLRLVDDIGRRIGLNRLSDWAHLKKDEWILNYLQNMLKSSVHKYEKCEDEGRKVDNAPIWICWWDGEKNTPMLVKQCIKSVEKNAGKHPVYLLSKENYSDYIDVPDYILHKLEGKRMGLAHFTDYLRVSLLKQYGGLWLDATIFCSKEIMSEYFEYPFFTCKSEIKKGCYLSDFQWTTFCLGGWENHVFYQFMKEALEVYWREETTAIDYLFFDDLIYIAKENIPSIWKALKNVPINNIHRDDLQAAMNARLPAQEFWDVIKEDTCLYKLSWREPYSKKSADGKMSVYGYFLEKLNEGA